MEAYIRYENGVPGCFYATTAYSADPKPIIELHCEKMTIRMEDPDVWLYDLDGKKKLYRLPGRIYTEKHIGEAGTLPALQIFITA